MTIYKLVNFTLIHNLTITYTLFMDIEEVLRKNIKIYRKSLGLSQDRLAELMELPSGEVISKFELGKRKPTVKNIEQLKNIFNITYEDLLGTKSQTKDNNNLKKLLTEISDYTEEDFKLLLEWVKLYRKTRG